MFDPRLCECKNNFKIETEGHFLPTWLLLRKEKKRKLRTLNTVTMEKKQLS